MKKIISFLLATMMTVSFSAVAFASASATATGSNATVELNATGDTAKVDVMFTTTYSEAFALQAIDAELVYDKTKLTFNSCEIVGASILGYNTGYSNLNPTEFEGVAVSCCDDSWTGSDASKEYVLKCNFTVNDTTTAASYDVKLRAWKAVDVNTYDMVDCEDINLSDVKATIKVGAAAAPQSFNAKVAYGAKAQAAKGIKFNLTTDDATKNVKTVDYSVPFFAENADKSGIENIGNIAVGLTINGVPSGVTVTANSAELY